MAFVPSFCRKKGCESEKNNMRNIVIVDANAVSNTHRENLSNFCIKVILSNQFFTYYVP